MTDRTARVSDHADLLAELGLAGVRWLGAGEGPHLVALIRACYGDTYSYAPLYQPEMIEAAWASGSLLSLGHFDARGQLDAHTGFWRKDPRGDYVESGLSLIHPDARRGFALDNAQMWRALLERWSGVVEFIHQNTTTRHVRAQLYARRLMHALPTGWVFDYALDEVLVGLAETPAPMHALTMTTRLRAAATPPNLAIPAGPWAAWLRALIEGVLPDARVREIEVGAGSTPLACEMIELNPSLSLRRRALVGSSTDARDDSALRVDLIHLPMQAAMVAKHWRSLLERGYLPVGVRPHQRRPSEIVLQAIADRGRCVDAIASMVLAGPRLQALATEWSRTCARTS